MDETERRALLAEALEYWGNNRLSKEQAQGRSIESMMAIAAAYGRGGEREARVVAGVLNTGPRYTDAIIFTCKELV
jgi:hypothetical protein